MKVETGSARPLEVGRGGGVKIQPGHKKLHFSLIFQKFREFATILRLSTFYSHLFALSVSVWYGNGYLIYIYKEECLSVCLFVMHSVPVIAIVTKLSMILP
jgi:hypothetical protein